MPVLIALFHDILITAGVYALADREVTTSTVAALLTILGYSLYDTIIVFDRIRENVPRMPRAAFTQIVNRSMAEVLTRSLATSLCTLLPVTALMLFGGETLQDFAFALLVGIASGAYSSIFIASPVLAEWKEREPVYRRRRKMVMEEHGGVVPAFATGAIADQEPGRGAAPRPRAGGRSGARRASRAGGGGAATATAPPKPPEAASRPSRRQAAEPPEPPEPEPPASRRRRPHATATDGRDGDGDRPPPRAEAEAPAPAEEAREAIADEHARLGDDGNRDLALHGVRARPLLGRDRRRLRRRDRSARPSSASSSPGFTVPGENDTDLAQALIAVPGRPDRARRSRGCTGRAWKRRQPRQHLAAGTTLRSIRLRDQHRSCARLPRTLEL